MINLGKASGLVLRDGWALPLLAVKRYAADSRLFVDACRDIRVKRISKEEQLRDNAEPVYL